MSDKNRFIFEMVSAGVLLLSAVLLVNPLQLWMPTMLHMIMLAVVVAAFGVIAVFVVFERVVDERDDAHRSLAGRAAFLVGSAILLMGIVVQTFAHTLDPWLVVALLGMVVAKIGARMWSSSNR